ncbi:hypothetical protein QJS04_geneDACA001110 [Acorus gramineus]|uniref:tRNA (adenine(58)-N(1))-methyltransferase non-catalytic subunit TRM6 n=1 Tax=Acorus gramineus TaxID=55184 RepID=A0AAV9ACW6_ACOGR|nr:hypothetical protein QJS04_geneDACA001110 [Acorus gramineus]
MSFQSLTMPVEIVPSETAENPNPRTAWEGCSVLLDINDGDRLVFARLTPSTTVKIGDKKLSLRPLVGCPFGSLFRVETGPKGAFLARVVSTPTADDAKGEEFCVKDEVRDNRALVDNNKAQGLSGEDIDEMRREGATGDDIVEALIANSSTFENKTSFSQEKYRLRKQKKYAPKVLLRRPFARRFLRVDTLSLLLSLANVSAYSDVLVVDMVGGIVTGAVAERLGGTGYVCNTHFGTKLYSTAIVRIFNSSSKVSCRSANPGRQASLEAIKSWKQNGFTSMIVAAPELDVESIIQDLLPLLSYSSPFAIYHQYLQVLPSRTHPHMQMSAFGGYILSGIRTCSSVDCAQGN